MILRRALPALIATVLLVAPALAGDIDLSGPWGDKYGCVNKDGQEVYAEKMLLLTADSLVTAAGACAFTGRVANRDGSLTLTADCEAEGEENPTPVTFIVTPGKKNGKLVVSDDTGFVMGEVARCK